MKTNYQEQIRQQAGLGDLADAIVAGMENKSEEQHELSTSRILKVQWLSESVTREMFKAITDEINTLEERARQLAYNYNNEQKHLEIVNLLVRATELRNIRETYGK